MDGDLRVTLILLAPLRFEARNFVSEEIPG